MKSEYIKFGLVGVLAGIVIGFIVANITYKGPIATTQTAAPANQGQTSVNSGGAKQELPPNHPPVVSGQTVPAPPLPDSPATPAAGEAAASSTGETIELPSLDPLPASSKEKRVEQDKKNIQALKGLPADRLTPIMFAFKNSLGVDCTYCHVKDHFEKDDKPAKQIARKMIAITREANAKMGAAGRVTCYTCHRGQPRPPQ